MLHDSKLIAGPKLWRQWRNFQPQILFSKTLEIPALVCIIHMMHSKEIIKQLEKNGWLLRGVKGSHHVYAHPDKPGHISVPHPRKELGTGLVHKLMKQAGLK